MREVLSIVVAALLTAACATQTPPASGSPDDAPPARGSPDDAAPVSGSPDAAPVSDQSVAMVVGTLHGQHLREREYPLAVLGALIEAFEPDLVLVEIRPAAFSKGQYEDGPLEMTYVTHVAKAKGIAVAPIDWFSLDMVTAPSLGTSDSDRAKSEADRALFEEEIKDLDPKLMQSPSFTQAHTLESRRSVLSFLNAQARYFGGNPMWNIRQGWFHHQAQVAIQRHQSKRALAFVGRLHWPELEGYLGGGGRSHRVRRVLRDARGRCSWSRPDRCVGCMETGRRPDQSGRKQCRDTGRKGRSTVANSRRGRTAEGRLLR